MTRIRRGPYPKRLWPSSVLSHPKLRGIFLGGCVERGIGSSFRAKAHAHVIGAHWGWICIRKPDRVLDELLLLHELAHIIVEEGHTPAWRAMVIELGGTLEEYETLKDYTGQVRP